MHETSFKDQEKLKEIFKYSIVGISKDLMQSKISHKFIESARCVSLNEIHDVIL